MKKLFIITNFIISFTSLNAQNTEEPKFKTEFNYGLFQSSFRLASNGGNYLSASFGHKINEDFWLNITFIKITAAGNFEKNSLFANNSTSYENTMIVPNFSKEWNLSNKFSLGGAIGGAFIFENVLVPHETDNKKLKFTNQGEDFTLGLFGKIGVNYEPIKNFYLRLSAKSYIPMHLNPDSYMIGFGTGIKL